MCTTSGLISIRSAKAWSTRTWAGLLLLLRTSYRTGVTLCANWLVGSTQGRKLEILMFAVSRKELCALTAWIAWTEQMLSSLCFRDKSYTSSCTKWSRAQSRREPHLKSLKTVLRTRLGTCGLIMLTLSLFCTLVHPLWRLISQGLGKGQGRENLTMPKTRFIVTT